MRVTDGEVSLEPPRRHRARWVVGSLLLVWALSAVWQLGKPLPDGLSLRGPERAAQDVTLLRDLTWQVGSHRVVDQQIFDAQLALIGRARKLIVADQFLYNDFGAERGAVQRPLSEELTQALLARKAAMPSLRIVLITDPINTVYGGLRDPQFEALLAAGIELRTTDLTQLRASNPAWTGLWVLCCSWLGNDADGGWLPNALGPGQVTLRSYLDMANFRANHRKTLVADDGAGGWNAIVASANPHDASSAHDNVALRFSGDAALDVIASEAAVPVDLPLPALPGPAAASTLDGARVQVLTEAGIRDAMLFTIAALQAGDRLDVATFYLSHRGVIEALLDAQSRGVALRVILDPNEDAFGRKKNGVPNRPVAAELVDAGIALRWCATNGEQCHSKLLLARRASGEATLIVGSANSTRRNLDDLNLESSVRLIADGSHPAIADAAALVDRVWSRTDPAPLSLPYERFDDESLAHRLYYRFGEAAGLSTW